MKISSLVLLLVAVLATSHCLTMHTERAQYFIYNPSYVNRPLRIAVSLSDDQIMFNGCNLNKANVTRDSEGTYTFSEWSVTKAYCANDKDPTIRNLFNSAKTSK